MRSAEWLGLHRDLIVERWKERVKPVVHGTPIEEWEERVYACFNQVQGLVALEAIELETRDVETKLFDCPAVTSHEQHRLSAWMLASGRGAIRDITRASGDTAAIRCASKCSGAIDYLEQTLQLNICRDCPLTACCMRAEIIEPMFGGLNE